MALTKPAGCAVQLFGACLFFIGIAKFADSVPTALVLIGVAVWLLYLGRQPSVKK